MERLRKQSDKNRPEPLKNGASGGHVQTRGSRTWPPPFFASIFEQPKYAEEKFKKVSACRRTFGEARTLASRRKVPEERFQKRQVSRSSSEILGSPHPLAVSNTDYRCSSTLPVPYADDKKRRLYTDLETSRKLLTCPFFSLVAFLCNDQLASRNP